MSIYDISDNAYRRFFIFIYFLLSILKRWISDMRASFF